MRTKCNVVQDGIMEQEKDIREKLVMSEETVVLTY